MRSMSLSCFASRASERLEQAMRAVLDENLTVFVGGNRGRDTPTPARRRAAREWIESTSRRELFDFEVLCDWLALDAGRIRASLRALRSRSAA